MENTKQEDNEHSNEELIIKTSMLQKQAEEINSHLEQIEKHVGELSILSENLNLFKEEGKEIISSIGKGVYAKTSLSGKNLLVGVGSNVLVEKTPEETKEIVASQIKQLNEARLQLKAQLEIYSHLLREALIEIQKTSQEK